MSKAGSSKHWLIGPTAVTYFGDIPKSAKDRKAYVTNLSGGKKALGIIAESVQLFRIVFDFLRSLSPPSQTGHGRLKKYDQCLRLCKRHIQKL